MMRVTPTQFASAAASRFERKLIDLLADGREDVLRSLCSDDGLVQIRSQVNHARNYGLTAEAHLASYVVTAWLFGPDFDERIPAMNEVLTSASLTPAAKVGEIEAIAEKLLAILAEEA